MRIDVRDFVFSEAWRARRGFMTIVSFSVIVSRVLAVDEVAAVFADMIPPGLSLVVRADGADVPEDLGSLWTTLQRTEDPAWPLALVVHYVGDECGLGSCPDLRIAEQFGDRFGVDVLCDVDASICVVDPRDPYYSLARVDGRWYLASTAGTRLMGPYLVARAEGVWGKERGGEPVRLIRSVSVPAPCMPIGRDVVLTSSRTASTPKPAHRDSRCVPSGDRSPACSVGVRLFLRY
jgi:hypothetical protein